MAAPFVLPPEVLDAIIRSGGPMMPDYRGPGAPIVARDPMTGQPLGPGGGVVPSFYPRPQPLDYGPVGMPPGQDTGMAPGWVAENAPQELAQTGDGIWQRMAAATRPGHDAFSFTPRRKPTGIEVLLAGLAGYGNAKTQMAQTGISEAEARNKRAQTAAAALATHRWQNARIQAADLAQQRSDAKREQDRAAERALKEKLGGLADQRGNRALDISGRRADIAQQNADANTVRSTRTGSGRTGGAPPRLTGSEREQMAVDSNLLTQINRIRELFKPEYVGLGKGVVGGAAQRIGVMSGDESRFREAVAGLRNQVLKARSGGAVTVGEAKRLMDEIPTVDNPGEAFTSKLGQFEQTLRDLAESRRRVISATGIDLSNVPQLPAPAAQRVRVIGPNNQTGTVPAGSKLPTGWRFAQ